MAEENPAFVKKTLKICTKQLYNLPYKVYGFTSHVWSQRQLFCLSSMAPEKTPSNWIRHRGAKEKFLCPSCQRRVRLETTGLDTSPQFQLMQQDALTTHWWWEVHTLIMSYGKALSISVGSDGIALPWHGRICFLCTRCAHKQPYFHFHLVPQRRIRTFVVARSEWENKTKWLIPQLVGWIIISELYQ